MKRKRNRKKGRKTVFIEKKCKNREKMKRKRNRKKEEKLTKKIKNKKTNRKYKRSKKKKRKTRKIQDYVCVCVWCVCVCVCVSCGKRKEKKQNRKKKVCVQKHRKGCASVAADFAASVSSIFGQQTHKKLYVCVGMYI